MFLHLEQGLKINCFQLDFRYGVEHLKISNKCLKHQARGSSSEMHAHHVFIYEGQNTKEKLTKPQRTISYQNKTDQQMYSRNESSSIFSSITPVCREFLAYDKNFCSSSEDVSKLPTFYFN